MKVLWILPGFFICLLSTCQIRASEALPTKYSLGSQYTFIEGSRDRRGHEWDLTAGARLTERTRIMTSYRRASRNFGSGETLYDHIGGVGAAYSWSRAYVLSEFKFSVDPHFSPQWSADLEPHWMWRDWDAGFGIQTKHYPDVQAWSLRPSLIIPIFSAIDLHGRVFWELRPENVAAAEIAMSLRPHPLWKLRTGYSYGKGDEGEGLIDEFHSTSVSVQWRALHWLQLGSIFELYRGGLRDENKLGATAECFF